MTQFLSLSNCGAAPSFCPAVILILLRFRSSLLPVQMEFNRDIECGWMIYSRLLRSGPHILARFFKHSLVRPMKLISLHLGKLALTGVLLCGCAHYTEEQISESSGPYTNPLASPGAKFGALPPAAQHTVRAQAGAAEIVDVERVHGISSPAYKIIFRNQDSFPPLYVAADGTLVTPDLTPAFGATRDEFGVVSAGPVTDVKINELPPPTLKAVHDRVPNGEIAHINKETWGDRVVYIVSFIDPVHHPRLYITADGKILNEGPK